MFRHSLLRRLVCFALALPCALRAQSPAPQGDALAASAPTVIRIDVQMVSLPKKDTLPLLPDLRDPAKAPAAVARLQEMIARGEAALEAWPEVLTKGGNRAVTEGIEEVRYPTEFEQPGGGRFGRESKPSDSLVGAHLSPTAFATRNVGITIEAEPTLGPDGQTIDVNIVPQHVRLLRFQKFVTKNDPGPVVEVEQPQFHTMKTTTSVTLHSGQHQLLGIFEVPESDRQELFILHAEVLAVQAEAAHPK